MPLPECYRIDASDDPAPFLRNGWREIEELVTFERPPACDGVMPGVRLREHWEWPVIKAIAETSFSEDRLHRDPQIPDEEADAFKVQCVASAIERRLPVLTYGQPMTLGFLIIRPEENVAVIDLMAVLSEHRGQGIGTKLVATFLGWAWEFRLCRAATQAHNEGAVRMYQNLGFREVKRQRTFHKDSS